MRFNPKIGAILLAIFLILYGLTSLIAVTFDVRFILGVFALLAGIFIVIDR